MARRGVSRLRRIARRRRTSWMMMTRWWWRRITRLRSVSGLLRESGLRYGITNRKIRYLH